MKIKWLVALSIFLFSIAIPLSDACSLTLTAPTNKTYTYTASIPLQYTLVNVTSCKYSTDNGVTNTTIAGCDLSTSFDVDLDSHYIFVLYGANATDECNASVEFTVDRSNTFGTNPIFYGMLMFFMIALSLLFIYASKIYRDEHQVIKGFMILCSLLAAMIGIAFIGFGVREYLKLAPDIIGMIDFFYAFLIIVIFVLFLYNLVMIFVRIAESLKLKEKRGRWRDEEYS